MLDRKADATMRDAAPDLGLTNVVLMLGEMLDADLLLKVAARMPGAAPALDRTNAVLMPVVPMIGEMAGEMLDADLLLKVADLIKVVAPVLDPTNVVQMPVVQMIGEMPDAVLHRKVVDPIKVAARKARRRDADLPQACILPSICWTETMMAMSVGKKLCTASHPLMPTMMAT